jgi:Leucine-rich repeat (LRR) protein
LVATLIVIAIAVPLSMQSSGDDNDDDNNNDNSLRACSFASQCLCTGLGSLVSCEDSGEAVLYFNDGGLTDLGPNTFASFDTDVAELYLHDNMIETVDDEAFVGLNSLEVLVLSRNPDKRAIEVNPAAMEPLVNLKFLSAYGTGLDCAPLLEALPAGVVCFTDLSLSGRGISDLGFDGSVFLGMDSATGILDLSDNALTSLPNGVFEGLGNIETLQLRNNGLATIEAGAFSPLSSLRLLSLGSNQLNEFGSWKGVFDGLANLRELRFHNNPISKVEPSLLAGLDNLEVLWLTSNEVLADVDLELPELKSLFIFGTRINCDQVIIPPFTTFPDCRDSSETLQYKWNGGGQMRDLGITGVEPGMFLNLDGVTGFLDLSLNAITELETDTFTGLTAITDVDLKQNQIEVVEPGAFGNMAALEQLDLRDNKIRVITGNNFEGCSVMKRLYLQDNEITGFTYQSFSGLAQLETLDLHNNQITSLGGGSFNGLGKLKELFLQINLIDTVEDGAFAGLLTLATLDLNYNTMEDVAPGVFDQLTVNEPVPLQALFLGSNFVNCDSVGVLRPPCNDAEYLSPCVMNSNEGRFQCQCGADGFLFNCEDFGNTVLDFSNSNIKTVTTGAFSGFTTIVTELYLNNNLIEDIQPGAFAALGVSLAVLDLGSNQLTAIDADDFLGLQLLKELRLHNNPLTAVTSNMFYSEMTSLFTLWLTASPTLEGVGIGSLVNLQNLYIFGTSVTCDSVSYGQSLCGGLQNTCCRETCKDRSPGCVATAVMGGGQMANRDINRLEPNLFLGLEDVGGSGDGPGFLDLSNNAIQKLDKGTFDGLNLVEKLHLQSNAIVGIQAETFSAMTALQELYLFENQIEIIELTTFAGLAALQKLFLNGNAITSIAAGSFLGKESLQELRLELNNLERLVSNTFSGLFGLTTIQLQGQVNRGIQVIENGAFSDLAACEFMDLRFNPLTNVATNTFATMGNLERLLLGSDFADCESVNVDSPPCDDGSKFYAADAVSL